MADDKKDGLDVRRVFEASVKTILPLAIQQISDPTTIPKKIMSSFGFNEGVRDIVRDTPWAVVWLTESLVVGDFQIPGDQRFSDKLATGIENFWDKYVKRATGHGQEGFRLAAGWTMPPGIKYDGQLHPKGADGQPLKEIADISAIFYRSKQGEVSVMTRRDPRWVEIVGPYIAAQIGFVALTAGAGGVIKGAPRAFTVGTKLLTVAETGGGIGAGGSAFAQPMFLSPRAINTLGNIFADPKSVTAETLRDNLNVALNQYSHESGMMMEQKYIRSLRPGQPPWERLNEVSQSRIRGYERVTPYDPLPSKSGIIENTNIRNGLMGDMAGEGGHKIFNRSFYGLAEKAFNGGLSSGPGAMTGQEVLALRFMLNVGAIGTGSAALSLDAPPAGLQFSQGQRDETLKALRQAFDSQMANDKSKDASSQADAAIAMFNDAADPNQDAQRLGFATAKKNFWQNKIDTDFTIVVPSAEVQAQRRANFLDPITGQPPTYGPKM